MTRAEVYSKIKEYGLQDMIKKTYGYNYTNISTATLITEVSDYEASLMYNNTPCKCDALIELLYKKHLICKSEYEQLKA